jgi:hypothetical protein
MSSSTAVDTAKSVKVSDVTSWTDAVQAVESTVGVATMAGMDDWGTVIKDKDSLIEEEFLIVEWKFHQGSFGEYVAALIIFPDSTKAVLTDGSMGIYAQLKGITTETGRTQGLHAKRGLRRSDYEVGGKPASTFYIAG